jgi:hypothetical protein
MISIVPGYWNADLDASLAASRACIYTCGMSQRGIPLHFQPLDPEVARKAIEGIPDVLTSETTKAEALYRQHKMCPNGCGPTMEKSFGGTQFAFSDPNWSIPRCLMTCYKCGHSINPFDGMTVSRGDSNIARYGDIPIINPSGDSR